MYFNPNHLIHYQLPQPLPSLVFDELPAEEGAEGFNEEEEYDGMPPLADADSLFIELQPIN